MAIDLSPDRLVSLHSPDMTLLQLMRLARHPDGVIVNWSRKDHRLLRVCKTLMRHGFLDKFTPEPGITIFRATKNKPPGL